MGRVDRDGVGPTSAKTCAAKNRCQRHGFLVAPAARRRRDGTVRAQLQRLGINPAAAATAPGAQERRQHAQSTGKIAQHQAEAALRCLRRAGPGAEFAKAADPSIPVREAASGRCAHLPGQRGAQPVGQGFQCIGGRRGAGGDRCRLVLGPSLGGKSLGVEQQQRLVLAGAADGAVAGTQQRQLAARLFAQFDPRLVDCLAAAAHQRAQAHHAAPVTLERQALEVVVRQVGIGAAQGARIELSRPVDPCQVIANCFGVHAHAPESARQTADCGASLRLRPDGGSVMGEKKPARLPAPVNGNRIAVFDQCVTGSSEIGRPPPLVPVARISQLRSNPEIAWSLGSRPIAGADRSGATPVAVSA